MGAPVQTMQPSAPAVEATPTAEARAQLQAPDRGGPPRALGRWAFAWSTTAVVAAIAVATVVLELHPVARAPFVVWTLFVAPAARMGRQLRVDAALDRWVIGSAAAVAVVVLLSQVLLYAGWWSSLALLGVVGAGATLAALVQDRWTQVHHPS
jgi:hypothetical protein